MRDRGTVLISVLWVVAIVAFVSFSLAASVRVQLAAAQNSFDSERAFYIAKSAAEIMFANLGQPDILSTVPVTTENGSYIFPFDSGEARVRFESNGGLIDINAASDRLLSSMFSSIGVEEQLRNQLVDSILDWRDVDDVPHLYGAEVDDYGQVVLGPGRLPRNADFQSLDELLLVKHMTRQIYYGHIEFDVATQSYRRIPGLRDLIIVGSGNVAVNVNQASFDVLAALPAMSRETATRIVAERDQRAFGSLQDLAGRITGLENSEAIQYMTTDVGPATAIVSTVTLQPSGTSRTVRLNFTRERQKRIINRVPLFYKEVDVIHSGRWQY